MQTNQPGSLKDRFENFGSAPSAGLWNAIESSLGDEKKKRRGFFWWWFGGIAAGLLIMIGIYQLGYQHGKSEVDINLAVQDSQHEDTVLPSEIHQQDSVSPISHATNTRQNLVWEKNEIGNTENASNNKTKKIRVDEKRENYTGKNQTIVTNITPVEPAETKVEEIKYSMFKLSGEVVCPLPNQIQFARLDGPVIHVDGENEKTGSWEFGLSGEFLATTFPSADMMLPPSSLTFDSGVNNNLIYGTESLSTPAIESNNTIYRPFNFSLSVARKFKQRWSIQSGLVFHRLIEKNKYYSGDVSFAHLKFTTVGIPLNVEFDYVNSKRFELSVGAGVMNEFPLLVTTRTTYFNTALPQEKSTQVSSGYFGAALVRLKFDYKFSDRLKAGLAPSMRYYFIQRLNSPHPVLERKFWVGMQAGITLSL